MASTLDSESSERLGGTCKAFSLDTAGTPKQALNRLELDLLWTILHLVTLSTRCMQGDDLLSEHQWTPVTTRSVSFLS